MTMIDTPLVLLAQQCGATFYTPGPTRAIRGLSFTFAQLEALAAQLRAEAGSIGALALEELMQLGYTVEAGAILPPRDLPEKAREFFGVVAAPGIEQLLDALSQHDDPCDDIAGAISRVRALRAEADRLTRAEHACADAAAFAVDAMNAVRRAVPAPSAATLNVLRVALERADMPHRATGFIDHEIATAVEWVRAARAAQAKEGGAR